MIARHEDALDPFPATETETEPMQLKIPEKPLRPTVQGSTPTDHLAEALVGEVARQDSLRINAGPITADTIRFTGELPKLEMMRFNQGKPRYSLIPPSFNYYTAMVLEYGAIKYDAENWRKGCKWNALIDSARRHLDSFAAGEDCDDESTLPHLAHLAFNVMALIEFYDKGLGTDDRYRYPDQAPGQRAPGRVLAFRDPPRRE